MIHHPTRPQVLQEDHLDPASLEILRDLKQSAVKKWHEQRHPGWGIFRCAPACWGAGLRAPAVSHGQASLCCLCTLCSLCAQRPTECLLSPLL